MERKISQYNFNNDFVQTFNSIEDVIKHYPFMNKKKILEACEKPDRKVYNYFWDHFTPFE